MPKLTHTPLAWTEDEAVLSKYPMLRDLARDLLAAYERKGIDPASLEQPDVEGQSIYDGNTQQNIGGLVISVGWN
ncbi:MAG: hypothetical protein DRI90_23950 [Deltaproteobacteria bacterium]|nr:MAG: hypothetical protein DRI90_23950 [Deltaproteobacteria bacterium]